jgi:hypothetical protein
MLMRKCHEYNDLHSCLRSLLWIMDYVLYVCIVLESDIILMFFRYTLATTTSTGSSQPNSTCVRKARETCRCSPHNTYRVDANELPATFR